MTGVGRRTRRIWTFLVPALSLASCGGPGDTAGTDPTPVPAPARVVVTGPDTIMVQGGSAQFSARLLDSAGIEMPGASFVWYSGDSGVAGVTQSGLVTARQPGWVSIFALHKPIVGGSSFEIRDSAIASHLQLNGWLAWVVVVGAHAYITRLAADTVAVIDLATGISLPPRPGDPGTLWGEMSFDSAANRLFLASGVRVRMLDAITLAVLDSSPAYFTMIEAPAVSPDGAHVWMAMPGLDSVFRLDTATLSTSASVRVYGAPASLAMHPILPRVYVGTKLTGTIVELDAVTLAVLRSWNLGGAVSRMAITADGGRLFATNSAGWIDEINLNSGVSLPHVALPGGPYHIAISPDETRLAVSVGMDFVYVLRSSNRSIAKTIRVGGEPRGLAFLPGSSRLIVVNNRGWIDITH